MGAESTYGGESERVDLNTESSDVLLLELSSQVTLDEGGLDRTRSQRKCRVVER